MIGAMPAVAVRHERRRQKKTSKRPSQLYLGGPWLPPSPSASPSPQDGPPEYYLCGKVCGKKVSALHMVVGSLLLGGVLLVVGLVQLSPGAGAAEHKYILLGTGSLMIVVGLLLTALRCFCIHCHEKEASDAAIRPPSQLVVGQHQHQQSHQPHPHQQQHQNNQPHHQHHHNQQQQQQHHYQYQQRNHAGGVGNADPGSAGDGPHTAVSSIEGLVTSSSATTSPPSEGEALIKQQQQQQHHHHHQNNHHNHQAGT